MLGLFLCVLPDYSNLSLLATSPKIQNDPIDIFDTKYICCVDFIFNQCR